MTDQCRYQALTRERDLLNSKWDEQNSLLVQSHERVIQDLTEEYEQKLQEEQVITLLLPCVPLSLALPSLLLLLLLLLLLRPMLHLCPTPTALLLWISYALNQFFLFCPLLCSAFESALQRAQMHNCCIRSALACLHCFHQFAWHQANPRCSHGKLLAYV